MKLTITGHVFDFVVQKCETVPDQLFWDFFCKTV